MNFKIILFVILIVQLTACHPISNASLYCNDEFYGRKISVNCYGIGLHTGICDHLMKNLEVFKIASLQNCEISEWSDIFESINKFPNINELVLLNNITLSSANFSQADHLSLFVMENGNFKTTPTSFSINGANLEMFQYIGNHNNDIDSFSLENSTKLEFFSLENTTLSHLPADLFKNSTNLTVVHLNSNEIESIDSIEWPNSVKWIILDSNKIAKLTKHSFRNLTNLEILELDKNEIGKIEGDAFFELKNLLYLNMKENNIERLNTKTFEGLRKLIFIVLDDNQIETIEAGAFEHTPELLFMQLNRNNISSLNQHAFAGSSELLSLDLSENPINQVDIDAFSDLSRLNHLNMSSGELETIDFSIFAKIYGLDILDLSNNKISRLVRIAPYLLPDVMTVLKPKDPLFQNLVGSVDLFKWLEPLLAKGYHLNQQTKQAIRGYHDVQKDLKKLVDDLLRDEYNLSLFFGNIQNDNNTTGHRLQMLDISRNQLTAIEKNIFADFENLQLLKISNNPIATLYPESFGGLRELIDLQMDHCALTAIDFSLFAHLDKLLTLDLSYNQLLTITAATLPLLKFLSLSDNRLSVIPLKKENVPRLYDFNVSNNKNLNCSSLDEFVKIKFYCELDNDTIERIGTYDGNWSLFW